MTRGEKLALLKEENGGTYPASTSDGGYTLIYIGAEDNSGERGVYCADCAEANMPIVAFEEYNEDTGQHCAECEKRIKPTYGFINEPDEED